MIDENGDEYQVMTPKQQLKILAIWIACVLVTIGLAAIPFLVK